MPDKVPSKICKTCRYWSDQIVRIEHPKRGMEACCLNVGQKFQGLWMSGNDRCGAWESGHLGAVDEPGFDTSLYQKELAA